MVSKLKHVFSPKMMTNHSLSNLAKGLNSVYNCVDRFEALEDKRGYDNGKQFPAELYKRGVQKQLLDHWLSSEPRIYTVDGDGYNFDARRAGCEWAAFLRVRDPGATVLRVYPKSRTVDPEHTLCQLLSSLIYNFISLLPREFDKVPDLCRRNFELLAQGGAPGIDAGLRILEALPPLELHGGRILCIVHGLNPAGSDGAADNIRQVTAVLGRILARNDGHLLYTVTR
ncbi:hypothetical protein SAMD00023353_2101580 [Rosellinia necatrix]|uniref:Uncharacterized protein n=1 Tax=Rosellinia necatrix TaxID=77044 RepID=A0A1W2TFB0_ROSNE|nr:hypothetical protein SAMD00023353_2101580 [Rosellinia necatrix]